MASEGVMMFGSVMRGNDIFGIFEDTKSFRTFSEVTE